MGADAKSRRSFAKTIIIKKSFTIDRSQGWARDKD